MCPITSALMAKIVRPEHNDHGVGLQLQLHVNPLTWELPYVCRMCGPKKDKTKK